MGGQQSRRSSSVSVDTEASFNNHARINFVSEDESEAGRECSEDENTIEDMSDPVSDKGDGDDVSLEDEEPKDLFEVCVQNEEKREDDEARNHFTEIADADAKPFADNVIDNDNVQTEKENEEIKCVKDGEKDEDKKEDYEYTDHIAEIAKQTVSENETAKCAKDRVKDEETKENDEERYCHTKAINSENIKDSDMLGTSDEKGNAICAKEEDKDMDEKKTEGDKGSDTAKDIKDNNMLNTKNTENDNGKFEKDDDKDEDKRNDNKGGDIVTEIVEAEHIIEGGDMDEERVWG